MGSFRYICRREIYSGSGIALHAEPPEPMEPMDPTTKLVFTHLTFVALISEGLLNMKCVYKISSGSCSQC